VECIGITQVHCPFKSISWSTFGEEGPYPYGLICGGMSDGSVLLLDANDIINYTKRVELDENLEVITNIGNVCHEQSLFDIPVNAIEFNPYKPHLIALGGKEVIIMDIQSNI
jgi:protein transport protein SEC31